MTQVLHTWLASRWKDGSCTSCGPDCQAQVFPGSLAIGQRAERQATPTSGSNCENKWQKAGKQCLVTNHGAKWIKYTSIDSITKSSMQNGSDCSQGPRMARNNLKIKSQASLRRNPCFQNSWRKFSLQSPGVLSQATPGWEGTVTPKPQGLVRSLQDSSLVGWERSISPNAEQPFVITVTREAGEWSTEKVSCSPVCVPPPPPSACISPGQGWDTSLNEEEKTCFTLWGSWAGISKDTLPSVDIQPCIHLCPNAHSVLGGPGSTGFGRRQGHILTALTNSAVQYSSSVGGTEAHSALLLHPCISPGFQSITEFSLQPPSHLHPGLITTHALPWSLVKI